MGATDPAEDYTLFYTEKRNGVLIPARGGGGGEGGG